MKLTANSALLLLNGLAQLDGYDKVVKDGDSEKIVKTGFTLSAKTKLAIALTRKRVGDFVNPVFEQRNALLRNLADGGETLTDQVKIEEFKKQEKELLEAEEEIQITTITTDDLQLDNENNRNISPSIILMIEAALSDFEPKA
jgi:hypothetical protein